VPEADSTESVSSRWSSGIAPRINQSFIFCHIYARILDWCGSSERNAAKTKKAEDAAMMAAPVQTASEPRAKSKGATILALIGRADGATLAEIIKATDWQQPT
jgi:hypothetical protein